jgi:hypothetical protein
VRRAGVWRQRAHRASLLPALRPTRHPPLKELVKPSGKILDLRTAITGITKADLKHVTTRREAVSRRLAALLGPDVVLVGHSLSADLAALRVSGRAARALRAGAGRPARGRGRCRVLAAPPLRPQRATAARSRLVTHLGIMRHCPLQGMPAHKHVSPPFPPRNSPLRAHARSWTTSP